MTTKQTFWVAHSPYANQTWRGLEKCTGASRHRGPLLFDTAAHCEYYIENEGLTHFVPVAVTLEYPVVGAKLEVSKT